MDQQAFLVKKMAILQCPLKFGFPDLTTCFKSAILNSNLISSKRGFLTMTSDQVHNPKNDHPYQGVVIMTQADFESVDLEAPIRASIQQSSATVDCLSLTDIYDTASKKQAQIGNKIPARVFRLIAEICGMCFKPEDRSKPYGPMIIMDDGRRAIIPSDLDGEQSDILATIAPNVKNPGLRARLSDVAWLSSNRKRSDMARMAINTYCDGVQMALDSKGKLSTCGTEMLHRACQVSHKLGWKDPEGSRLKSLFRDIIQDAYDREDHWGFMEGAEISRYLEFSIGDPADLAKKAEKLGNL